MLGDGDVEHAELENQLLAEQGGLLDARFEIEAVPGTLEVGRVRAEGEPDTMKRPRLLNNGHA